MLQGLRVLLVEDNALVNMRPAELMARMGCRVTRAMNLGVALEGADSRTPGRGCSRHRPRRADLLSARRTTGSLGRLEVLGVPIIFLTGYATHSSEAKWGRYPRCTKPCQDAELKRFLSQAALDRAMPGLRRGKISEVL